MKIVRFLGNAKIAVEDAPKPEPSEGEVLIRVTASGICGSELKSFRSEKGLESNAGHEVVGIVEDPRGSALLEAGDRVGVHAVWGCGRCRWCVAGKYTYCDNRGGLRGAHTEWLCAPDHCCLKLADDVPDDVGVLLTADGLGVPYHLNQRLNTRGGDVVVVIGVGPIGLGNVLLQSYFGAEVIAIDVNDFRLGLARGLGAKHTINASRQDPRNVVSELTGGLMADKCIEAAGHAETLLLALDLVGKGGCVGVVGEQHEVPIDPGKHLIRGDIALLGSWFYHYGEYPSMVDLYRRGLAIPKLITDHFPLSQADAAYEKFAAGKTGKVILKP